MAEFDEKLNSLLSNPDAMSQIMQLAQSLSGNGAFSPPERALLSPPHRRLPSSLRLSSNPRRRPIRETSSLPWQAASTPLC